MTYIQDILSLCQKADPNMPDSEKLPHVLKGIADHAFQLLVFKDCTTMEEVVKECRRFEEAQKRRITANIVRLPNTTPTSTCEDTSLQADHVAKLIHRELEAKAMFPVNTFTRPTEQQEPVLPVSTVQAVIRQEINRLHVPKYPPGRRTPFTRLDYDSLPPNASSNLRDPAAWRTPDNRPICFQCNAVGHIARYCHNRGTTVHACSDRTVIGPHLVTSSLHLSAPILKMTDSSPLLLDTAARHLHVSANHCPPLPAAHLSGPCPPSIGKLSDGASRGEAALGSLVRNPLRQRSLAPHNQIFVTIDNVGTTTLVDTGAAIFVMREHLRRQLRKVLTPPDSTSLRGADGCLIPFLDMCSARISLKDKTTSVVFIVIPNCPHALILG